MTPRTPAIAPASTRAAIHYRCAALDDAIDIQDRTAARIVEGVVFKQHDAMGDRVER